MKSVFIVLLSVLSLTSFAQFKSEDSASINIAGGNTDLKTYTLKSNNAYEVNKSIYKFNGAYHYGESDSVRSAENWSLGLRYDYAFLPLTGLYFGELIEADRFSGYDRRFNTDLGMTHFFYKSDSSSLLAEAGLRYTIQKQLDNSEDKKGFKGRLFVEATEVIQENIKGKFWVEYLPNFSESEDYLLNIEPSLIIALNKTLSMKTAYLWKYDNQPTVSKSKYDYNYTLSLIANF
ncbi:YdiY family protein [Halobacteriovorax sp.]|uniref:DUF481 domain-containing protein n=1 Tax=Halobacteriovorax sp. TaxID=2020862 RepID=UPI003569341B